MTNIFPIFYKHQFPNWFSQSDFPHFSSFSYQFCIYWQQNICLCCPCCHCAWLRAQMVDLLLLICLLSWPYASHNSKRDDSLSKILKVGNIFVWLW